MFPKEIADHLWEKLTIRERPVGCSQPGIVAGNQCACDDQKKRGASDQQRETMDTPVHISDCRLPIADCRSLILSNRKSAIGNRKFPSVPAQHWKFERRHHLEAWFAVGSCRLAECEIGLSTSACRNGHGHLLRRPGG